MTNVTLRRIREIAKIVWAEIQQVLIRYQLYDSAKEAFEYLHEHPVLLAIIIGMALTCTIPVLIFILFVLISLVVTFTGFLIVEGLLLSIGTVLLFGFISAMLIVVGTVMSVMGVLYFGFIEFSGLSVPALNPVSTLNNGDQILSRSDNSNRSSNENHED